MHLSDNHLRHKPVSAKSIFEGAEGTATAIQLLSGQQLKAHISKVAGLLLCVEGEVAYKDENGIELKLAPGEYTPIIPMVKHWLDGLEDSQLLLLK